LAPQQQGTSEAPAGATPSDLAGDGRLGSPPSSAQQRTSQPASEPATELQGRSSQAQQAAGSGGDDAADRAAPQADSPALAAPAAALQSNPSQEAPVAASKQQQKQDPPPAPEASAALELVQEEDRQLQPRDAAAAPDSLQVSALDVAHMVSSHVNKLTGNGTARDVAAGLAGLEEVAQLLERSLHSAPQVCALEKQGCTGGGRGGRPPYGRISIISIISIKQHLRQQPQAPRGWQLPRLRTELMLPACRRSER
jgi:hypothetical protein